MKQYKRRNRWWKKALLLLVIIAVFMPSIMAKAEKMITTLMGDNIEARKQYISEHADFNKVDKIAEKYLKK